MRCVPCLLAILCTDLIRSLMSAGYSYCYSCSDYQALMPRRGNEAGYDPMPVCAFCIPACCLYYFRVVSSFRVDNARHRRPIPPSWADGAKLHKLATLNCIRCSGPQRALTRITRVWQLYHDICVLCACGQAESRTAAPDGRHRLLVRGSFLYAPSVRVRRSRPRRALVCFEKTFPHRERFDWRM